MTETRADARVKISIGFRRDVPSVGIAPEVYVRSFDPIDQQLLYCSRALICARTLLHRQLIR
jgi:hypothetical protein